MKLIPNLAHVDQIAIERLGIPGLILMEQAGRHVADQVTHCIDPYDAPHVVIVSGPGNNGGDGSVCARYLAQQGIARVTLIHSTPSEALSGDAQINFTLLAHYPIEVICAPENPAQAKEALKKADYIVDALFGSGLSRPIQGLAAELIETINQAPAMVIAVDLPSGVDGRTGQVLGIAVQAGVTVTFATGKPGLFLGSGKHHAGDVVVVDIGLPSALITDDPSPIQLITEDLASTWLPDRDPGGHKYSVGATLIIAGSRSMPGAAMLVSEAALASGAGLVALAAPESVFQQSQFIPEIIRIPLPETPQGTLGPDAFTSLKETLQAKAWHAVALGPGLGHQPETVALLGQLLSELTQSQKPVILDADGLNCLSLLKAQGKPITLGPSYVLTPHVGEATRLWQVDKATLEADLLKAAHALQEAYNSQVVLKSASTVLAGTDGSLWISPVGNSGMATAGSGDVLTGLIAGLSAQGLSLNQAALLGVYLHGLSGDLAASVYTEYCLRAHHLIDTLPLAFQYLQEGSIQDASEAPGEAFP